MLEVQVVAKSALAGYVAVGATRDERVLRLVVRQIMRDLREVELADPGLAPVAEGQRAALAAALRAAGVEVPEPRGGRR